MLTKLNALRNREEGFTLIELLIVVIIIGILAAIALPIFIDQQKVAVDASVQSDVRNSVTNITNAQAQQASSATAAVSRVGTTIAVTDNTDSTKSRSVTRASASATTTLTAVPALGDDYTVAGTNPDGKKYQGLAVTGGKAYTFASATGSFSEIKVVDPGTYSSFETDDPNRSSWSNCGNPAVCGFTTEQAHSGSYSIKGSYQNGSHVGISQLPTKPAIVKGNKYTVTGWAYTNSTTSTDELHLSFPFSNSDLNVATLPSQKWTQFSYTFTVPADANAAYPRYFFYGYNTGGGAERLLYLDDVRIVAAD